MFEASGALAFVQPVPWLAGLVVLPLLWAVVAAAREAIGASRRGGMIAAGAAIGVAASILALALAVAVRLARLGRGHVLVQHVTDVVRLGQLDLALDLALDPRGAAAVLVVAVVATASVLQTTTAARPAAGTQLAWTGLTTAGAMLVCAGDGLAPLLVGLGVLTLGAWGLGGGADLASSVASFGGNVAVLVGFVFLFWSLGGAFGPEGYDPDGAPRFVLVTTSSPASAPDKATFMMTTHAGARVSSDDSDLPAEPITSPFSVAVEPGVHTLRVQGGAASADVVVPRVAFVAGQTHALTPYGPTASLRALDDQVAVPRRAPDGSVASVGATLAGRAIHGLRASAVVLVLVLGGALAHLFALARRRGPRPLAATLVALPAPWLAIRLAPLVDPAAAVLALAVVAVVAWAARGVGLGALFLHRSVTAMDRHVVGAVSAAIHERLWAAASTAVLATGEAERPRTITLVVMVALLGLVVLFSLLG